MSNKLNGIHIPMNGEPVLVEQHGESAYEFIRAAVGGFIEPVSLSGGTYMYVNEEGKLLGLPVNKKAMRLCWHNARSLMLSGDFIVGSVIVVGSLDRVGNHRRLTKEQIAEISALIAVRDTTTNTEEV